VKHAEKVDPDSLPGLGSVTWRQFGELPGAFLAGTGLLLQVAHPVVGAGVREHSEFKTKPWVRAWRTHLSTMRFVYGAGSGAYAEGARLIEAHKGIKGVDGHGNRYHALNPEAYAWVHLTLAKFMVDTAHWFGDPLTPSELDQMWTEFRAVGLALGVKEHHMPEDWDGAQRRFDEVLRDRLEATRSTYDVLTSLARPAKPIPGLPDPVWRLLVAPAAHVLRLTTVGTLPPELRERMGLSWTAADERKLRRFARLVRATRKVTPERLRYTPLAYAEIARARRAARRTRMDSVAGEAGIT
jgi:uncharacterized protein (DUF2236 family)